MRRFFLIALLVALAPFANAQRIGSASPRFASGINRGGHPRSFFYPLTFSDPFYSDYLSSAGYPAASQPPLVVVQALPAGAPVPDAPAPGQSLMFELRGDRYVRVSGPEMSETGMSETAMSAPTFADQPPTDQLPASAHQPQRSSTTPIHAVAPPDLPPVLLVFRDGHREEVSDYTIADGVLYTRGDYSTGSWNRKIELSSLNLPETLKSNQSRGARFQLPSSPNEVIVRP